MSLFWLGYFWNGYFYFVVAKEGARITLYQSYDHLGILLVKELLGFGLGINSEFIRPENLRFVQKKNRLFLKTVSLPIGKKFWTEIMLTNFGDIMETSTVIEGPWRPLLKWSRQIKCSREPSWFEWTLVALLKGGL